MNSSANMPEVQRALSELFGLSMHNDKTDFVNQLALEINGLILHDFNRLISILYRIDINEIELKKMLQQYSQVDAGLIIAQLIIDRQMEKAALRSKFRKEDNIPDEDKW